ncbi:MAG: hypothetical protein HYU69_11905 [Bacteroidetes bacterium]|nr:hypothetical protein [Bacteroidota bacterium]
MIAATQRNMISKYLMGSGILYNKNKTDYNELNLQQMARNSERIEEVRKLINVELGECNHVLWPKVCEMRGTTEGQRRLEDMIIRLCAEEGMGIGPAIAQTEQELGHEIL